MTEVSTSLLPALNLPDWWQGVEVKNNKVIFTYPKLACHVHASKLRSSTHSAHSWLHTSAWVDILCCPNNLIWHRLFSFSVSPRGNHGSASLRWPHPSPWVDVLRCPNDPIWHRSFLLIQCQPSSNPQGNHGSTCTQFGISRFFSFGVSSRQIIKASTVLLVLGSWFSCTLGEMFYVSLATRFGIGHFVVSAWMSFIYPAG
jgi:hypothetical protein